MVAPNNPIPLPARALRARLHDRALPQDAEAEVEARDPRSRSARSPSSRCSWRRSTKYYKGIIELNLTNEIDDFAVTKVDAKTKTLTTKAGKTWKADVANVIPQQRAGAIAHKMGLTQGDWCPVNAENFTSTKVKDIYVLGDATIAAEMPKSAFSANSQAKVVAADILAVLAKKPKFSPNFRNTCWSMVAPNDSVKIGAGYVPKGQKLDPVAPFVSKPGEDAGLRKQIYQESLAWYDGIVADVFAKPAPGAKGGKRA